MTEKNNTKWPLVGKYLLVGIATLGLSSMSARADQQMKKVMDHGKMDHGKMDHSKMMKAPAATIGDLSISGPWARMSFGKAVNSAGFMIITNKGARDDQLISASSKIAKRTELHTHIRDGEIMRMRRVEGGIPVPRGGAAKLQPGGFHVMFIGLHKPLKNGDSFPVTLKFEHAGDVTLEVTARKGMKMDHGKMDHSKMDHGK